MTPDGSTVRRTHETLLAHVLRNLLLLSMWDSNVQKTLAKTKKERVGASLTSLYAYLCKVLLRQSNGQRVLVHLYAARRL